MTTFACHDELRDEHDAYVELEQRFWPDGPRCPHCGCTTMYFIEPANGVSRLTHSGSSTARRVWKCRACRQQCSVLTGTVFHGCKVKAANIVRALDILEAEPRLSCRQLAMRLSITQRAAFELRQRIRHRCAALKTERDRQRRLRAFDVSMAQHHLATVPMQRLVALYLADILRPLDRESQCR